MTSLRLGLNITKICKTAGGVIEFDVTKHRDDEKNGDRAYYLAIGRRLAIVQRTAKSIVFKFKVEAEMNEDGTNSARKYLKLGSVLRADAL